MIHARQLQKRHISIIIFDFPNLFEFELILLLPVIIYKEEEHKRHRENFWKSIQLLFIKRKNGREKFWKLIQILFILRV